MNSLAEILAGLGREVCSFPVSAAKHKVSEWILFCQEQRGLLLQELGWRVLSCLASLYPPQQAATPQYWTRKNRAGLGTVNKVRRDLDWWTSSKWWGHSVGCVVKIKHPNQWGTWPDTDVATTHLQHSQSGGKSQLTAAPRKWGALAGASSHSFFFTTALIKLTLCSQQNS